MRRTLCRLPLRVRGLAAILMISLGWLGSPTICRAQYTNGIDVSYWQGGSINWNAVRSAGTEFAFIRATLGTILVDDYLSTNHTRAMATGMYVGFYHYGTLDQQVGPNDAFNEANHFVNNIRSIYQQGGNLLRPVIDVETLPGLGSGNKAYVSQWVRDFIGVVKTQLGVVPIIYCNTNYASNYFEADLAQYDLWIANYNYAPPTIPPASIDGIWNGWDFWQYTQSGRVNGISGDVDRNVYNGTLSQMIDNFAVTKPSADFNGDGVTDGNDFLIWQRNYGLSGSSTFAMGDANRNGVVTGADLLLWKQYFGQASGWGAAAAVGAVPEPSAAALFATGAMASVLGMAAARRRR